MSHEPPRRFPFATVGVVLSLVAALPMVIGMLTAFSRMEDGQVPDATLSSAISLSFHPALIVCGSVGVLLVAIGLVRAVSRAGQRSVS